MHISPEGSGSAGRLRNVSRVTRFFRPDAKHIRPKGSTGADADAPFSWRSNNSDDQKQEWKQTVDAWKESEQRGRSKRIEAPLSTGASRASKKRKRKQGKSNHAVQQEPVLTQATNENNEKTSFKFESNEEDDEDFFTVAKPQTETKSHSRKTTKTTKTKAKKKPKTKKEVEDSIKFSDDMDDEPFSTLDDLADLADLNASTTM
jgi:hypothetical protein